MKYFILILTLMVMLSTSVVDAADNSADDFLDDGDTNVLSAPAGTSFSSLKQLIDESPDGNISLPYSYTYDDSQDGAYSDGIEISKAVNINGNGFTIDGNNQARIFYIAADGVTLSNITFKNGIADAGAAICSFGNNLNITMASFESNNASKQGGAIYSRGDNLNIALTSFESNTAYDGGGSIFSTSDLIMFNVTFRDNNATGSDFGFGGAIYSEGADLNVSLAIFESNNAPSGGGAIYSKKGFVNIYNATFGNNTVNRNGIGGAICSVYGFVNIFNATFGNNTVNRNGIGGAIASLNGTLNITLASFESNHAGDGGAIYSENNNIIMFNVTFRGNNATDMGGAIASANSTVSMFNVTFRGNNATDDGGAIISVNSTVSMFNVTFRGNNATDMGGAIASANSTVSMFNVTFRGNNAANVGGAIYSRDCALNIALASFESNSAILGGAIYLNRGNFTVSLASFESNSAMWAAGAIYSVNSTLNMSVTSFESNTAMSGGAIALNGVADMFNVTFRDNAAWDREYGDSFGGAIYSVYADLNISLAVFESNTAADDGGAIYSVNGTLNMSGITFESNVANMTGGAIYSLNNTVSMFNVTFRNNNATETNSGGGAIYSGNSNLNIALASFESNSAVFGGAIASGNGTLDITSASFESNSAVLGGAISLNGVADMFNVTFRNNTAWKYGKSDSWGGAIYSWDADLNISLASFESNHAGTSGGAIYSVNGNLDITSASFESNSALESGGAIYTDEGLVNIIASSFNGNNAIQGSAIFADYGSETYVKDTEFGKNRANATAVDIGISEYETYNRNIAVDVKFTGQDNIANAIWSGVSSNIHLQNIACEFSKDGKGSTVKSFNTEAYAEPTYGFVDEDHIWLDSHEDAQMVDILIMNNRTGEVVLNITSGYDNAAKNSRKGLLKASNEDPILTDVNGNIHIELQNLRPGTYTVKATHVGDEYYTGIEKTDTFVIYGLDVTKTTQDTEVNLGENVTYNITITSICEEPLSEITVNDTFPEGFELLDYSKDTWHCQGNVFIYIADGGVLKPSQCINLILVFNATKEGTFNNTIKVTNNKTSFVSATSAKTKVNNFTVLDVVKSSDAKGNVLVGDAVNFTITVTNKGPVDAHDINITDILDEAFEIMAIGNETSYQDSHKIVWNMARLAKGSTASVWVSVKVNRNGTFNNTAIVRSAESKEANDTISIAADPKVILTIEKSAAPKNVEVGYLVNFTISVTNNGPSDATDVVVEDKIISEFEIDAIGNETLSKKAGDSIIWTIPTLTSGDSTNVWISVRAKTNGTFTNGASSKCSENTTKVSAKADVTVSPVVDLRINKTVDKTNISVGDEVTYTIIVVNDGPSTATGVNVTDTMEGSVKITKVIPSIGYYDDGIWHIGTLNKGEKVDLTITVKTLEVGTVKNSVAVNSTEKDRNASSNRYSCKNVTVNAIPSFVSAQNVTVTYGDTITVPVTSDGAVNVTYEVVKEGNVVASGTVEAGEDIVGLVLAAGSYSVNLTTVVDVNHTSVNNMSSIVVNPAKSYVSAQNITATYNDAITIPVTSNGAINVTYKVIKEGNIVTNGTIKAGKNIVNLILAAGNYTVNLTTVTDVNHTSANNISYITVNPAKSYVSAQNITATYNDAITIPVTTENAINVTYKIIKEGNVVASGTVKQGMNITGLALDAGNYTVNLTTITDANHTSANNISYITVVPIPSFVSAEDVTVTYGEDINIRVTSENAIGVTYQVIDGNGNVVASGNVEPNVISSLRASEFSSDGIISGLKLSAGNYKVNLTTVPDVNYAAVNYVSSLAVNPAKSSVEGEDVVANVGDYIVIAITSKNATSITYQIIGDDGVVANGTVEIGENIAVSNLPAGHYEVDLMANADGNHTPSKGSSTIVVNKIPSSAVPTVSNIDVGENEIIQINVGADDAEGSVNVTLNNKSYGNVPVVNGNAQIIVSNLPAGTYTVVVKYSGDDKYLSSEGSTTFKVEKIVPSIKMVDSAITIGKDKKITISLPEDATGTVTIEVYGKSYTQPVINGKVTFNLSGLKAGEYKIKICYSGDEKYCPINTTGIIKVLPSENNSQKNKIEHLKTGLGVYETANPIMALMIVLIALGFCQLRRFRK